MKEKIEELAKIKIKNGFLKFLEKTLIYFNIKDVENLNEENSFKIVEFLHNSPNKSCISYWVLRTNLKEDEIMNEMNAHNLLKSHLIKNNKSYTGKKRSQIIKKQNDNYHGFGYSGWFTKNNINYYLRSKKEFIFLNYLIESKPKSNFKMECEVYEYDNFTYKPDIFEFDEYDNLICIYEVKYKKEDFNNEKYIKFGEYAEGVLKVPFIKLFDINKIVKQNPSILKEFEEWKLKLIEHNSSLNFSLNNPMLGMKQKESTKQLIGRKAKERFENVEYRENISSKAKEFFADKNSEGYKNWLNSINDSHKIRREEFNKNNPLIKKNCAMCGSEFETRKENDVCCNKNGCKLNYRIKFEGLQRKTASKEGLKKAYIGRIFGYIDTIDFNYDTTFDEFSERIYKNKINNIIPEKFGMTSDFVINKYFGDYEKMKIEYLNYKRGENVFKN